MSTAPIGSAKGFIVVYRWAVEPEHEAEFRERWRATTLRGREFGALGSCFTRDENGQFVAVAIWPSKQARSDAFEVMGAGPPWTGAQRLAESKLSVEDDLWLNSPLEGAPQQTG